jgi:hypothetical protein
MHTTTKPGLPPQSDAGEWDEVAWDQKACGNMQHIKIYKLHW